MRLTYKGVYFKINKRGGYDGQLKDFNIWKAAEFVVHISPL